MQELLKTHTVLQYIYSATISVLNIVIFAKHLVQIFRDIVTATDYVCTTSWAFSLVNTCFTDRHVPHSSTACDVDHGVVFILPASTDLQLT